MSALSDLRTGPRADLALFVATVVGVAAASVHWAGLVVGGVLVGVLATSVSRAGVQGLTFGGVVLAIHVAFVWWAGALDAQLSTGILFVLTIAVGFALPTVAAVGARAVTETG
ncbi:hypothetical protein ACH9L7_07125 [Haloferax sp. S1W]|uniref:hypothetical protein n=1 Tax=Haloferax sp. S1W TaxID=3377110 RepID=UPI0037C8E17F